MTKALKSIHADVHFRMQHLLKEEPELTHREFAQKNSALAQEALIIVLKALIEIGHNKPDNFSKNPNKSFY